MTKEFYRSKDATDEDIEAFNSCIADILDAFERHEISIAAPVIMQVVVNVYLNTAPNREDAKNQCITRISEMFDLIGSADSKYGEGLN